MPVLRAHGAAQQPTSHQTAAAAQQPPQQLGQQQPQIQQQQPAYCAKPAAPPSTAATAQARWGAAAPQAAQAPGPSRIQPQAPTIHTPSISRGGGGSRPGARQPLQPVHSNGATAIRPHSWQPPAPATAKPSTTPQTAAAATAIAAAATGGGGSSQAAGLCFPGPEAAAAAAKRCVAIPTAHATAAAYQAAVAAALVEEINLRVGEQARQFHALAQQHAPGGGNQQQQRGPGGHLQQRPGVLHQQQQQQQQQQQRGPVSADPWSPLVEACRRAGLSYHPDSTLKVWRDISTYFSGGRGGKGRGAGGSRRGGKGSWGKGGRRGGGGDDDDGEGEEEGGGEEEGPKTSVTLVLGGHVDRRKHRCAAGSTWLVGWLVGWLVWSRKTFMTNPPQTESECTESKCRKHELWVISSQPTMAATQRGHWVALARWAAGCLTHACV